MKVKTTPGLQYTVAVHVRAYSRSPNMNHPLGMRQNEPLFAMSFWTTGVGGAAVCCHALLFVIVPLQNPICGQSARHFIPRSAFKNWRTGLKLRFEIKCGSD